MAAPKRVELTLDEQRQLKERLRQSNLNTGDQQILLGLIDFNQWLQLSLQEKKIRACWHLDTHLTAYLPRLVPERWTQNFGNKAIKSIC